MREIPIRDFEAERRFVLDLGTHPYAEFQNGLEFIGRIVPPVVVAKCMRWQVVVGSMSTAGAMRKDMICMPLPVNGAAADVATSCSLSEHFFALGRRERTGAVQSFHEALPSDAGVSAATHGGIQQMPRASPQ